jgi:hypothetical protein
MFAIGMQIEKIVEDVESGGAESVECESNERADQRFHRQVVRKGKRQKQQKILCPVVAAERAKPGRRSEKETTREVRGCEFERGYGCGLIRREPRVPTT